MIFRPPGLLASLFVCLIVLFPGALPAQETVDVVILSGQSNMAGSGRISQLHESWRQPIPAAQYWDGKAFVTLDPHKVALNRDGRFGPELGFARNFTTLFPEKPIYLVKFALGGQPLHAGWDGSQWQGEEPGPGRKTFYPGQSPDDPNVGLHYQRLRASFEAAFAALKQAGKKPQLRGVLWMQGEQDAKHLTSADHYDQMLTLLKRRIEEDLHSDPVPFVLGQVLPHEPANARFLYRDEIRRAQMDVDMRSSSSKAASGVWTISTDGLPLEADTVHYSTLGQQMLGQLFALGLVQAESHLQMIRAAEEPPRSAR